MTPTPLASLQTVTFDVHDAKIAPLLTDPSTGAATYDDWLDIPGVQQVQVNPQFVTAELKGDAKIIDQRAKTSGFDMTLNYALLDLNVLLALYGGALVNTSGDEATWKLHGTNSLPYFRLAFAVNDVSTGLGNLTVLLHKAKVTGGNLFDQQTDQYGQRSLQINAIPTLGTDDLIDVYLNKVLTAVEDVWPDTP